MSQNLETCAEFSIPWESELVKEITCGILGRKSRPDVSFYGIIVELTDIENDFFIVDWSADCLYLTESADRAQSCNFTQDDLVKFTALADRMLASRMRKTHPADSGMLN